jgi:hypothetical protein
MLSNMGALFPELARDGRAACIEEAGQGRYL